VTVGAIGAAGAVGGAVTVIQTQGTVRVEASCAGGSGRVAFGDGTSAELSSSTGPITHTYSSAGRHQVTVTCTGGTGQPAVGTATVGASPARPAKTLCLHIPRGAVLDAIERLLTALDVSLCRR
jgi:hypothetical protein